MDLIPKFIMACGNLVKILLHTKVTRYLEFKSIDGSYVLKDNKVQKIPSTPAEALSSPLMGFFEKRKFRNFLMFLQSYDKEKPSTYLKGMSLDRITCRKMFEEYGLDANTQVIILIKHLFIIFVSLSSDMPWHYIVMMLILINLPLKLLKYLSFIV